MLLKLNFNFFLPGQVPKKTSVTVLFRGTSSLERDMGFGSSQQFTAFTEELCHEPPLMMKKLGVGAPNKTSRRNPHQKHVSNS
jgi:hypothetical protein